MSDEPKVIQDATVEQMANHIKSKYDNELFIELDNWMNENVPTVDAAFALCTMMIAKCIYLMATDDNSKDGLFQAAGALVKSAQLTSGRPQ